MIIWIFICLYVCTLCTRYIQTSWNVYINYVKIHCFPFKMWNMIELMRPVIKYSFVIIHRSKMRNEIFIVLFDLIFISLQTTKLLENAHKCLCHAPTLKAFYISFAIHYSFVKHIASVRKLTLKVKSCYAKKYFDA